MPPAGASQATAEHTRPSSHARISEEDRIELKKLELSVSRMQKHTRPDPYIVTIAQDRQQQYQYQWRAQQYQWLQGAPFKYDEGEGIQYQTFVFQEPGTNMLSLHAQHYPEERPGTADSTRNATGSNTPAQGPKKVISFGAYKKKQTGETPARDNSDIRDRGKSDKQPAVKGPAERAKALEAESADMIKAVEEDGKVDTTQHVLSQKEAPREKGVQSKQPELKRKREEDMSAPENKPTELNGKHSPPLFKKSRTDTSTPVLQETNGRRATSPAQTKPNANKQDVEKDTHMPPKLSPLRDEPEALDIFELPPRLSPELPANIDAALKANKGQHTVNRDDRKDDKRAVGTKTPAAFQNESSELHSNSKTGQKSTDVLGDKPPANAASKKQQSQPLVNGQGSDERKSLVVKIRFKKARKEDVQRILKLPARPDKRLVSLTSMADTSDEEDDPEPDPLRKEAASKQMEKPDQSRRPGKGVAQRIGPLSKKTEDRQATSEKRPRAETTAEALDASDPPAKKRRVDDDAHEQSTKKKQVDSVSSQQPKKKVPNALDLKKAPDRPLTPAVPSPAVHKGQIATPGIRKDLVHPKRDTPTDSQIETPPAQSSTPSEQKRSSQPNGTTTRPPSSNPNSSQPATSQAWDIEQKRLERLGRELKHGASALLSNKPSSTARRTAAAKSLESLICYLLAFTCSDRAALVAQQNIPMRPWRSLTPYCSFVGRASQDYASLDGLASGLSVVIHARILDIAAQYPSEGPSRDSLIELSGALRKAAIHAEENLDVDMISTTFPKSWAARSKTSLAAPGPSDFGEPGKLLQGGYRLPLGVQTDALQAARAGVALLKEWIAKEGLDYEFKVTS